MIRASLFGIRGIDIDGHDFGILYCQIADIRPAACGCKVELVTGETIKLRESRDGLQAHIAPYL